MATLLHQAFVDEILGKFYPDSSWLKECKNFDALVKYDKINFAEVGADPTVNVDGAYPLTAAQRTDAASDVVLKTFDTTPTFVSNVEELETAYDKLASVTIQHTKSLYKAASIAGAKAICDATSAEAGTAIATKAAAISYKDILALRAKFNKADLPQEGRVLVLCPEHEEALLAEDADRYKVMIETGKIAGFKVYTHSSNPKYNATSDKFEDYNSTTSGLKEEVSFAFVSDEVMRAMGSIEGEPEKRWADYRGWLIGFQMRFICQPIRTTAVGVYALYTK